MYWSKHSRDRHIGLLLALVLLAGCLAGCGMSSSSSGSGSGGGGLHTVNLSWKASTSSNIVGYNIYRGTAADSFGLLSSMNPGTTYTDTTVQNGQTYYYAVKAVDSAGVESSYSNTAQAAVP